jgi:hypothetical protein
MESFCTLTPKGEMYLRDLERENPALYKKLRERVLEAIRTMPRTEKALMDACYAAAHRELEEDRRKREQREENNGTGSNQRMDHTPRSRD